MRFAILPIICLATAAPVAQQNHSATLHESTSTTDTLQAIVSRAPAEIGAGETFEFTVKLDKAPNFPGGQVSYSVQAPMVSFGESCVESAEAPVHRVYHCGFTVPHTAMGGIWTIQEIRFIEGAMSYSLPFNRTSFRVIPKTGLILPTSAEVTVNLNQKQLLRREAGRIGERIQQLKSTIAEYSGGAAQNAVAPLLKRNLADSVEALKTTQGEFTKLTTAEGQQANAMVFFDDLLRSYNSAISHLGPLRSELKRRAQVIAVSEKSASTEPLLALTLRPMEQNELAYKIVADEGSLTFDLEADSTPEGAKISYFRRGDPPHENPDQTRATIPKLPYAIWTIRFEKPGYRAVEREHDPFREPNHVVHVDLQK